MRGRDPTPAMRLDHVGVVDEVHRAAPRQAGELVHEERAHAFAADVRDDAEGPFTKRFDLDLQGYSLSMPNKSANVKNEKQYEALKDKGMSKQRAARIANSPGASSRGGKSSSKSSSSQGGTTAQKKAAGRKGGRATARTS